MLDRRHALVAVSLTVCVRASERASGTRVCCGADACACAAACEKAVQMTDSPHSGADWHHGVLTDSPARL